MRAGEPFRAWFDALEDMIHVVDRDLRLVFVNAALRKAAEARGSERLQPGDRLPAAFPFPREEQREGYARVFLSGDTVRLESEERLPGGERSRATARLTPVFGPGGGVEQVVTVITLGAACLEAGETHRLSEERYRAVVEDSPLFICRFLPDGVITFANEAYTRYYHRSREELIGADIFSFIPEESREKKRRLHLSRTPENSVVIETHQAIVPGRGLRWHRWTDRAIFEEGRLVEFQAVGEDITEQHRMTEALRHSEERFRLALENSLTCLYAMDIDLGYTWLFNSNFGLDPDQSTGKTYSDFFPQEDAARLSALTRRVIETGIGERGEMSLSRNGRSKYIVYSLFPLRGENGDITGIIGASRDVTELKLLERRIEELRREYEAFMRHELKNLFIPLRLHADLLLHDSPENLTPRQRDCLEKIRESTIQGTECIDSLRRIQELETGTRALHLVHSPLERVIHAVLSDLALRVKERGVDVRFDCRAARTDMKLDPHLMPGVFFNLILNAIEHVENLDDPAEKKVRILLEERDGTLDVRISNRGEPVPPDRLAAFFEKFNGSGKGQGRLGLGTAYARLVVRAHGGEIRVSSSAEAGTAVTVALPIVQGFGHGR